MRDAIAMPKSILPDGLDATRLVIIKECASLRLTDEIRIAATAAKESRREFILAVREDCVFSAELSDFLEQNSVTVVRTAS